MLRASSALVVVVASRRLMYSNVSATSKLLARGEELVWHGIYRNVEGAIRNIAYQLAQKLNSAWRMIVYSRSPHPSYMI
jgi:hypothetical protein